MMRRLLLAALALCGAHAASAQVGLPAGIAQLAPVSGGGGAPLAAIDGSVTTTATAQTCVIALTTAHSPDVIIVTSKSTPVSGTPDVTGIADTAGLTWSLRKKLTPASNATFEEWYAIASGTLSSDSITVTYTSNPGNYSERCTAFGISGANTGAPFDGNASIPSGTSCTSCTSLGPTISTNSSKTMLLASLFAQTGSFGTITRPSGFSQILATGSVEDNSASVVSSAQSSVTETFSWSGGASNWDSLILDAVVSN